MRTHTKTFIVVAILLILGFVVLRFVGASFLSTLSPSIEVVEEQLIDGDSASIGSKAPYFSLSPLAGEKVDLASFSGDGVILVFWSTWNSSSADQIKILDDYIVTHEAELRDAHVHLVAINSQEHRGVVVNFMRRGGYDVETLLDERGETSVAYGVQTLPTIVFINQSGTIVDRVVGTISERMLVDKMEQVLHQD